MKEVIRKIFAIALACVMIMPSQVYAMDNGTGFQIEGKNIVYYENGKKNEDYTRSAAAILALSSAEQAAAIKLLDATMKEEKMEDIPLSENALPVKNNVKNAIEKTYLNYGFGTFNLSSVNLKKDDAGNVVSGKLSLNAVMASQNKKMIQDSVAARKKLLAFIKSSGASSKSGAKNKVNALDTYICKYLGKMTSGKTLNLLETLTKKKGMCYEYAVLFYYSCRELGIPCRIIEGKGSGEAHAWNQVKISGKWYYLDCIWNDVGSKSSKKYYLSTKALKSHTSAKVTRDTTKE